MTKKIIKILMLLTLSVFFLVGCSKSKTEKNNKKEDLVTVNTTKGEVKVPKNPKKVVIFDFASLDVIDALNIDTKLALPVKNLPSSLKKYATNATDAGEIKEPNLEKINEFAPDLIIINGRQSKAYDELSKIAPTLYTDIDMKNYIASVNENSKIIGRIFGKEKEADEKIAEINKEIEEVKKITKDYNKKVLFALTNDGKISTFGPDSRFGFVFKDLGLQPVDNAVKSSIHGQDINYEYISEKNPDVIFYVDRTKVVGGSKEGGDVLKNELVSNTNAGKNNKIIPLDPEKWYIISGGLNTLKLQIADIKAAIQ